MKHQEGADRRTKNEMKRVDPMKDTTRRGTVAVQTGAATSTSQKSSKVR